MPFVPEAELKRPDLKGRFGCNQCGKTTFCHTSSLNRHRVKKHGDDVTCLICQAQLEKKTTVHEHMRERHSLASVFTCGCCNWTFPNKRELAAHRRSIKASGTPGDAEVIAKGTMEPGSLLQQNAPPTPDIIDAPAAESMRRILIDSTLVKLLQVQLAAAAAQLASAEGENMMPRALGSHSRKRKSIDEVLEFLKKKSPE